MADGGELEHWLTDGDAPEADWSSFVLKRALAGQLGDGGPGILLDLPALRQAYGCSPALCTPGMRGPRDRSCCADLEVGLTEREEAAIRAALPELVPLFAGDPRWRRGPPEVIEEGVLRRQGRRCIFARMGKDGLSCGLHALEDATGRPRGALKPMPCRLFPLAVVELGDGSLLLTAIARDTARLLASRPARAFPCLGTGGVPLFESERAAITELFGATAWRRISRACRAEG